MIDNGEPTTENRALKRIVSLISSEKAVRMGARGVAYFAAAATVYLIAGGDITALAAASPVLARLIESIGADTLATILEKVGRGGGEPASTEQTLKQIEDALVNADLEAILTEREFYRAIRILQQQDSSRYQELSHHVLSVMDSLNRIRPGDPSPLSLLPRSARPRPTNAPLVGRENDLSWLRKTLGDRILIGQPGIGKTSVLFHLAIEGNGRFVLSHDRGEIAAALVQEQPSIVVVDDAHHVPDLLLELRQLREETGITFDIVASTWPSSKEVISENLAIGASKEHELALLTRDEMVEVIKSAGLIGPDELIREIVNQAVGRPGLARTLTELCLDNSVQDLFSGDALRRSVVKILDDLALQRNVRLILATLSLAGDYGMNLEDAERLLGIRFFEMWSPLDSLAGSGIIYDAAPSRISVRPAALREALVGEVFFGGVSSISARELIIQLPDLMPSIALTLVGSRARGGAVPDQLLVEVLEASSSVDAWRHYAGLGKDEAERVLSLRPDLIVSVAYPALYHVPESAILMLLNAAIGDDRPLNSNPNHPLRLLGGWVKSTRPGSGEAVPRRQKLLRMTLGWLDVGRDVYVGLQAVQYALLPGFEFISTDPGSGMTATMHFGSLSLDELKQIEGLWNEFLPLLDTIRGRQWGPIKDLIGNWAFPGRTTGGRHVPEEVYDRMRTMAEQMLVDVAQIAATQPGVMHWVQRVADNLGLDIQVTLDDDFRVLYPHREREDWKAAEREERAQATELAKRWCNADPRSVVERVVEIEIAARESDLNYPRWTGHVFRVISSETDSTIPWLEVLLENDATWDMVFPLLEDARNEDESKWLELALACLESPAYRIAPVMITLAMKEPPQELLERVLQFLPDFSQTVEVMCLRNEVSDDNLKRLLQHKNHSVSRAAAWGEWNADPKHEVRKSVDDEWRLVVINCKENEYWLRDIFAQREDIAFEWLQNLLVKPDFHLFELKESIQSAVDTIGIESRGRILSNLDPSWSESSEIVTLLVGDHLDLYQTLLASEALREFHLTPLAGDLNEIWIQKARLALEANYSPAEIEAVVFPGFFSWSGKLSDMWQEWVERFEQLRQDEDDQIKEIGSIGLRRAEAYRDDALRRERDEAVFGWR